MNRFETVLDRIRANDLTVDDDVMRVLQRAGDQIAVLVEMSRDGKEIDEYSNDTPCTYAIQFTVLNGKLNMSVVMRSNDLWYGFCNDQYQFASLQEMVADRLSIPVGWYYHHAHNLHLYNDKIK